MVNESSGTPVEGEATGPLFDEFPPATYDEWRQAVEKVLKGAPFEKRLVSKTYEGIDLQPLYRQEDVASLPYIDSLPGFAPYVRGAEPLGYKQKPWDVCQELPYGSPTVFNQALRSDLERGQNAVNLPLDGASRAGLDADQAAPDAVGQGGVSIASLDDLGQALDGVELEKTPLFIQCGALSLPVAALLIAALRQHGKSADTLRGCLAVDPLGTLAREGSLPVPLVSAYDGMAKLTAWATAHAPRWQTLAVHGAPYHDSGGSAVQELAFVLATAVEYLRELEARGLAIDTIAPRIRFAFSIGSNFFMEIARLRSARQLWARIVQAFGGTAEAGKMSIHARTSTWNKTAYDPYVNMLRATTEAFAGVVGGCDSLHVAPFDEVIRAPDEFSRRVARNVHTILREESHLTRTIDPAGGSWYVESLTDAVAKQAWSLFQAVEKQGGLFKALQAGFPQTQVAEVGAKRFADAARRRAVFVGTNMYPNLLEKPLDVPAVDPHVFQRERAARLEQYRAALDSDWRQAALAKLAQGGDNLVEAAIQAASAGATLGDLTQTLYADAGAGPTVKPMDMRRGAVPFEALRKAAEAFAARAGSRPKVFLATMGPLAQHKARADFARGFLEVGGFEVIYPKGFNTPAEAAKAAGDSGVSAVVICSTDPTYPELVPPLVQAIKAAKPGTIVMLAGYPADQVDAHRAAGIDDFIYLGGNCYDVLLTLQKKTGVAP